MARTTPPRNPPAPASTRKKPRAATTTRKPNYGKRAARNITFFAGGTVIGSLLVGWALERW